MVILLSCKTSCTGCSLSCQCISMRFVRGYEVKALVLIFTMPPLRVHFYSLLSMDLRAGFSQGLTNWLIGWLEGRLAGCFWLGAEVVRLAGWWTSCLLWWDLQGQNGFLAWLDLCGGCGPFFSQRQNVSKKAHAHTIAMKSSGPSYDKTCCEIQMLNRIQKNASSTFEAYEEFRCAFRKHLCSV